MTWEIFELLLLFYSFKIIYRWQVLSTQKASNLLELVILLFVNLDKWKFSKLWRALKNPSETIKSSTNERSSMSFSIIRKFMWFLSKSLTYIEFFYRTLLKEIILWVSDPALRQFVVDYVTKHSGTEVATNTKNREIRNKCLFRLSLAILNDTVFDVMMESNYELEFILEPSNFMVEYKRLFDRQLPVLKKYRKDSEITFVCSKHGIVSNCMTLDTDLRPCYSSLLLIYFWYFIVTGNNTYIRNPDHRQIATLWSQFISVMYLDGCCEVKEEAVTLMMGLAICSSDFELKSPFTVLQLPLRPLKNMKREEVQHDPTSLIARKFINSMPDIDEGAFAFISVSKDLFQRKNGNVSDTNL